MDTKKSQTTAAQQTRQVCAADVARDGGAAISRQDASAPRAAARRARPLPKRRSIRCETFLLLNDIDLLADDLALYPVVLALAEGKLPKRGFATWLRGHTKVKHGRRVQEPRKPRYRAHG